MELDPLQRPCGSEVQCADLASIKSAHCQHADASSSGDQVGFETTVALTYLSRHDLNKIDHTTKMTVLTMKHCEIQNTSE